MRSSSARRSLTSELMLMLHSYLEREAFVGAEWHQRCAQVRYWQAAHAEKFTPLTLGKMLERENFAAPRWVAGWRSRTQWTRIIPKASTIGTFTMPLCVPSIKAKAGVALPSAKA